MEQDLSTWEAGDMRQWQTSFLADRSAGGWCPGYWVKKENTVSENCLSSLYSVIKQKRDAYVSRLNTIYQNNLTKVCVLASKPGESFDI
jgi:hypothetical protein